MLLICKNPHPSQLLGKGKLYARVQVLERITDEVLAGKSIAGHPVFQYRLFQKLVIDYLLENGSRVVFFLPPYPPPIYEACVKKAPCTIASIETMLRSLARSRNIPVYGSYDPGRFNLSIKDFLDQSHTRDYVVRDIFKEFPQAAATSTEQTFSGRTP